MGKLVCALYINRRTWHSKGHYKSSSWLHDEKWLKTNKHGSAHQTSRLPELISCELSEGNQTSVPHRAPKLATYSYTHYKVIPVMEKTFPE